MKIIINPDNLIPDESWQYFYKVRAIIENEKGEIVISEEHGKYIFPGGKREKGETDEEALQRELKEETGIVIGTSDFARILELETLYKDFYDYRSASLKPRFTHIVYYYIKSKDEINFSQMSLTDGEIIGNFKIRFCK